MPWPFDKLVDYIRRPSYVLPHGKADLGKSNVQLRQRLAFPLASATECLGTAPGITKCTQDH